MLGCGRGDPSAGRSRRPSHGRSRCCRSPGWQTRRCSAPKRRSKCGSRCDRRGAINHRCRRSTRRRGFCLSFETNTAADRPRNGCSAHQRIGHQALALAVVEREPRHAEMGFVVAASPGRANQNTQPPLSVGAKRAISAYESEVTWRSPLASKSCTTASLCACRPGEKRTTSAANNPHLYRCRPNVTCSRQDHRGMAARDSRCHCRRCPSATRRRLGGVCALRRPQAVSALHDDPSPPDDDTAFARQTFLTAAPAYHRWQCRSRSMIRPST